MIGVADRDHGVHVRLPGGNDDFGDQRGTLIGEQGMRQDRNAVQRQKQLGGLAAHARRASGGKNQRSRPVLGVACEKQISGLMSQFSHDRTQPFYVE